MDSREAEFLQFRFNESFNFSVFPFSVLQNGEVAQPLAAVGFGEWRGPRVLCRLAVCGVQSFRDADISLLTVRGASGRRESASSSQRSQPCAAFLPGLQSLFTAEAGKVGEGEGETEVLHGLPSIWHIPEAKVYKSVHFFNRL